MDIVKIKDIGSQMVIYNGQKHSKVKFKETSKIPERYYWTVNSNLTVGETFSTDKVYVVTGSANTRFGDSIFGCPSRDGFTDFRVFWATHDNHFYFDSSSSGLNRKDETNTNAHYTGLYTYGVSYNHAKVWYNTYYHSITDIWAHQYYFDFSLTGDTHTDQDELSFISFGERESFNLYEFKVFQKKHTYASWDGYDIERDEHFTLVKHYIPMKDGRHFYDVLNKTQVDTRRFFTVHRSDLTQNKLAVDIPGLYY